MTRGLDNFYLIYLKKNSLKWYTSSISMLSKNDTSRLHTSYIYNEFDGIGFLWGVKETPDLKSVKVNIKNTETIIDLEDIDYWYLVTITEITEFDRNISALLKDGTKIKNLE